MGATPAEPTKTTYPTRMEVHTQRSEQRGASKRAGDMSWSYPRFSNEDRRHGQSRGFSVEYKCNISTPREEDGLACWLQLMYPRAQLCTPDSGTRTTAASVTRLRFANTVVREPMRQREYTRGVLVREPTTATYPIVATRSDGPSTPHPALRVKHASRLWG